MPDARSISAEHQCLNSDCFGKSAFYWSFVRVKQFKNFSSSSN
ncbi:hypothetical protein SynNOUM97013_00085 [Synechococcus sp. NOUM97013]|nr:hypothetical protein SynNOUM97013_00085 [Synechococcus sp. NOUM97013]